jgi:hypothetical protein
MFKIFINDGKQEPPKDDIYYIICKEGIFLKKKLGIMESVVPVSEISVLNSIAKTAKLHIDPIPREEVIKIWNFFREVYEKYKSEGNILLFYDPETKTHIPYVPKQEVGGASVSYNKGIQMEGCIMLGTIHSHANFSAFHSGVDDSDEKTFDGLHITFGNVMDATPSISASIVSNGTRFHVNPEEYLLGVKKTTETGVEEKSIPITTVYRWIDNKYVKDEEQSKKYSYNYTTGNKRFAIEATEEEIKKFVDKNWIKNVSKYEYKYDPNAFYKKYRQHRGIYGGYPGYPQITRSYETYRGHSNAFWDEEYDAWFGNAHTPSYKPESHDANGKTLKETIPSKSASPGSSFDSNPCEFCYHIDKKIEFVYDLLKAARPEIFDEDYEEEMKTKINEDGEVIETYACDPCKVMIEVAENESDTAVCPKCKSSNNLIIVYDEEEAKENMEKDFVLFRYPKPTFILEDVIKENGNVKEVKESKDSKDYSREEEIHKMAEADSGDVLYDHSDAFLEYVIDEIKEHKKRNNHRPFPSRFERKNRHIFNNRAHGNIKTPFYGFSGAVVAPEAQDSKPETPKITVIKRDGNKN